MTARPYTSGAPTGRTIRVRRAALAVGLAMSFSGAGIGLAACGGDDSSSAYKVRAIFSSAAFVQKGLDVKVAGVPVGSVTDVDLTPDNHAAVTFAITDPGFQDFRRDATCTIRPQALIGERYLFCDLTEPRPDGATAPPPLERIADGPYRGQRLLPEDRTAVPVDSDEVLNANTGSVRDRFGIIIRELGTGVAGRGDEIAEALDKGNEALTNTNRILKQLDDDTDTLKELVASSDATLQSLKANRGGISGTIANGAKVASTVARNKGQVKASISALNAAFKEIEPTVDRATELTDELQPIADDLNRSAPDLATILNGLPEVSRQASRATTSLGPTLRRGREVLTTDETDTLFRRTTRTADAVRASGAVLGLTLGDFRQTGGLDYFLDAIWGLTYATNGRDGNGSYLRAAALNVLNCALPDRGTGATACGPTRLTTETNPTASDDDEDDASAARASGSRPSGSSVPSGPSSSDQAASNLLLGGGQ